MKTIKRVLAVVLALTMMLALAACSKPVQTGSDAAEKTTEAAKTKITVQVVKSDKSTKDFVIETTADNLEAALLEEKGLVEGEQGDYGLFIKTVDGERADYDLDKAFWSISKDGTALATGANQQKIADGDHYEITYTPAE